MQGFSIFYAVAENICAPDKAELALKLESLKDEARQKLQSLLVKEVLRCLTSLKEGTQVRSSDHVREAARSRIEGVLKVKTLESLAVRDVDIVTTNTNVACF